MSDRGGGLLTTLDSCARRPQTLLASSAMADIIGASALPRPRPSESVSDDTSDIHKNEIRCLAVPLYVYIGAVYPRLRACLL
jgi:hypothetical protein